MNNLVNKIQRSSVLDSAVFRGNSLKEFINNFYFENPVWSDLPAGFPFCDTSKLNKEEKGLYSGIKMAWLVYRADIAQQEVSQYLSHQPLVNNLYATGKILFYLLFLFLLTGNLINYILIHLYQTIL